MLDYDSWLESPYWELDKGGDDVCQQNTILEFSIDFFIREKTISYKGNISQYIEYITGFGDVDNSEYLVDKEIKGNLSLKELFPIEFTNKLKNKVDSWDNSIGNKNKLDATDKINLCFMRGILSDKNKQYNLKGWIKEQEYSSIEELNDNIQEIFTYTLCIQDPFIFDIQQKRLMRLA